MQKAAASKVKADKAALTEASKIKSAGSSLFGGPFVALIKRNANFDQEFQRIDSVFKKEKIHTPSS